MSIKQEQQIYRELCGITVQILKSQGMEEWAENVLQYGQCTQQEVPSPSVMIDYSDGSKYGWESTKYKWNKASQSGKAEISYYRQIYVDFLFFRNPHDLIEGSLIPETPIEESGVYLSPIDVAQRLRTWFLSDLGISSLRGLGYGIIDSSEMENPDIETDDDVYARTPRFTLTLVTKETTFVDADFIKNFKLDIKVIP